MHVRLVVAIVGMLLAGCIDGGDSEVAPTTSASPTPLKPEQVLKQEVNACPGGSPPVQTAATTGRFEVKPGYDEIIIGFHSSGEGQGGAEIRWVEEGTVIWGRPSNTQITSAPIACGGHSHTGGTITKTVEPGNYTTRLSYTGAVAIHFEITARSNKTMETAPTHTHPTP